MKLLIILLMVLNVYVFNLYISININKYINKQFIKIIN